VSTAFSASAAAAPSQVIAASAMNQKPSSGKAGGEQQEQHPVRHPERAPHAVHRRRDAVSGAEGPHACQELGQATEEGGEGEQVEWRLGIAVPARHVPGDDEGRPGEAEQTENRGSGDRLQEHLGFRRPTGQMAVDIGSHALIDLHDPLLCGA